MIIKIEYHSYHVCIGNVSVTYPTVRGGEGDLPSGVGVVRETYAAVLGW